MSDENEKKFHLESLPTREEVIAALRMGDPSLLHAYVISREAKVISIVDGIEFIVENAVLYIEAGLMDDALIALGDAAEQAWCERLDAKALEIEALADSVRAEMEAGVATPLAVPSQFEKGSDRPFMLNEESVLSFKQKEQRIRDDIGALLAAGLVAPDEMTEGLRQAVFDRRVAQYLVTIPGETRRKVAIEEINFGNLPPELLASEDSFVVAESKVVQ